MQSPRPLECPVCGHERIAKRPVRRSTETGTLRVGMNEWTCQLCAYAWVHPLHPGRDLVVGLE